MCLFTVHPSTSPTTAHSFLLNVGQKTVKEGAIGKDVFAATERRNH